MFENILIPTDGSAEIAQVVESALSICRPDGAHIHTLYIVDHRALLPLGEDEQQTIAQALKQEGESALERVSDAVHGSEQEFDVSTFVAQGIPSQQILAYAAEYDIDAIVLGSHGQTMRNQAIGSTTERVVRGVNQIADTTVIIIPIGPDRGPHREEQAISDAARDMFR